MINTCSVRQISSSHNTLDAVFCCANKIAGGISFRTEPISHLGIPQEIKEDILTFGFNKITLAGFHLFTEFRGKGLATTFWAKAEALRIMTLPEENLRLTFDVAHMIEFGDEFMTGWTSAHFAMMQSLLRLEGCVIQNHWERKIRGTDAFLWEVAIR